ncbi:MAG: tetratricopeptide repeat-containing sensor histidine kinase, partial [Bacteroidota bacterium]
LVNRIIYIVLFSLSTPDLLAQNLTTQWHRLESLAPETPKRFADSARNYTLQALAIARQNDNERQLAITYHKLGKFSNELRDFDGAITYLNLGLDHAKNDTVKAAIYIALGRTYSDLLKPDSAIIYTFRGLEINKRLGPEYEAKSLRRLAFCYRTMVKYDTSLSYLKRALEKEKQAGLDSCVKRSYMNIGLLYCDREQYDSAMYYFNKSYALISSNDIRGNAIYNNNIAITCLAQGNIKQAILYAEKSLEWKIKLGNHESLTFAYNILSDLYLELGDYQKAEDYAWSAINTIDSFPASRAKFNAHRHLLKAKIKLRDTTGALKLLNTTLAIQDELYEEDKARTSTKTTVQSDDGKKEYENQLLRNAALADDNTINNQYAIILAGSIVLILLVALVLIISDRSKQNRIAHLQMSEQKEEIEAQRNQLEEMNHTKDRFFGIISHDLRGPVNAFQGLSALTRMYLKKGNKDQIHALIDKMDSSSNRLSRLLDNLLNWALTQEGSFPYSPERFTLEDRLHEVLDIFPLSAKAKGISIEDLTDHSLAIYADPNGFKTIVRNLINNAIKYSKKGDTIKIKSFKEGELVSIQVCDTGAGMSPEQIEHLFNLETKESTPGTSGEKGSGLGLVLCQELIHLNKGKIGVESELYNGTTFTVTFPKG